jgi:hypothetical protein
MKDYWQYKVSQEVANPETQLSCVFYLQMQIFFTPEGFKSMALYMPNVLIEPLHFLSDKIQFKLF